MGHIFSFFLALIAAACFAIFPKPCAATDDVATQLSALAASDRAGMDNLAQRLDTESRQTVKKLIAVAFSGKETEARKAAYVLNRIGDLAMLPLLEAKAPENPLDSVWQYELIVKTQLNLQQLIISKLEQMLDDKRMIPYPQESAPIEEEPLEERVCDRAYIHLQKLKACNASEYERESAANAYLRMTFADRNRKIAEYLHKRARDDQSGKERRPAPPLAE